jgi:hypothetical protein
MKDYFGNSSKTTPTTSAVTRKNAKRLASLWNLLRKEHGSNSYMLYEEDLLHDGLATPTPSVNLNKSECLNMSMPAIAQLNCIALNPWE